MKIPPFLAELSLFVFLGSVAMLWTVLLRLLEFLRHGTSSTLARAPEPPLEMKEMLPWAAPGPGSGYPGSWTIDLFLEVPSELLQDTLSLEYSFW